MGRLFYEDASHENQNEQFSMDEKPYHEPNSVHISEDWDTIMEDFLDDFDDYQDVNFPRIDDDV